MIKKKKSKITISLVILSSLGLIVGFFFLVMGLLRINSPAPIFPLPPYILTAYIFLIPSFVVLGTLAIFHVTKTKRNKIT
jgi:hypothetical protein